MKYYSIETSVEEHPDGEWVRREDYDALLPLARFGRWCLSHQQRGPDDDSEDAEAERLGLLARNDGVFLRETDAAKVIE